MKNLILSAAMSALLLVSACGPAYEKPTAGSDIGFALDFFKQVNASSENGANVVVSPYSAGVALSMLAEGAAGETRAEFDDVLNGCLFKAEPSSDGKVIAESANSLWIDGGFKVKDKYTELLASDFDALVKTEDFSDPSTVKAINDWCSEHTSGKITEIIDRLNTEMVMVLVNALYFNAPWEKSFDPAMTNEETFHGTKGEKKVQMMSMQSEFYYAEYEGFSVIAIPYSGGRYAMYVVLPPAGMNVDSALPYVNEYTYDAAMDMMTSCEVRLKLPKFTLETSQVLNGILMSMGLKSAFTPAADFSGISSNGALVLDQVKQKCYIDVSEKGTEAAAVTSAQIKLTSAAITPRPVEMVVDRPFLFLIADSQTENILFAGKILNL